MLLKRHERAGKFQSKYYTKLYSVKKRDKAIVIVEDKNGNRFARNITFVKKVDAPVNAPQSNINVTPPTSVPERKVYPFRHRHRKT